MGKEMCWTSSRPGKTREMNAFGIGGTKGGESKIVLLDMPGYGKASRPEWGVEIMKYLQGRKQWVPHYSNCSSPTELFASPAHR
jgi:GTP-binding protein